MLNQKEIDIIRGCVPVLRQRGVELTTNFYRLMFTNNPEVKHFFSEDRQKSGLQAKALAMSLLAAAQNIDNLSAILPTIIQIGKAHVKVGIKPEHYPIVGSNLLLALKETLKEDATDELIDTWAKAYDVIAEVFIEEERKLYEKI